MRAVSYVGVITTLALAAMVSLGAQDVTVEGTLVDSKCYLGMNETDDDHGQMAACGKACLNMGQPAGLVTADGTFHAIIAPAKDLANHVGHTVRISGTLRDGAILATKAEMNANGRYSEIALSGMM